MKTRSIVTLALLAATVSTISGVASADTCPTPSLVQCRDTTYLGTTCGQASLAENGSCTTQLRSAYQTETQKPDVSVGEVMVPNQPGLTTPAAVKRYQFFAHKAQNFAGQFLGVEQKGQLLSAGGGQVNLFTDQGTILGLTNLKTQRQAWEANGNAISETGRCAEYVHERFRGYTAWKDLADLNLASDEVLYDKAYDPSVGIANRTLYSKSGQSTLPPVEFPSNGVIGTIIVGGKPTPIVDSKSAKNAFFKAFKSLNKGTFFGPSDTALKAKLATPSAQSHHVVDWNWHKNMHDQLTPSYDDETLRFYQDLQTDFTRLVAQREEIQALIAKYGTVWTTPDASRNLGAELTAVEAAIRSELLEADASGCLDTANPTKCDWAHSMLREHVAGFYSKKMEAAYQTCVANTGNDFSPTSLIRTAGRINAPKADYTGSAEDVEAFSGALQSYMANVDFPKDPATGMPHLGDQTSDSGTIGSGDLSLDWSYAAGWSIDNIQAPKQACEATLKTNGSFKAVGHAYGTDIEVIDAKAEIYTEQQQGKAKVQVSVLGSKIWDKWNSPYSTELSAGLAKEYKSGTSKDFSTTIYPFGIPVTLSAGVGMSVGMKVNAKASVGGSCASTPTGTTIVDLANVSGTVTPWAQADAHGSVAVGIPGFQAGIKCNVIIVRGEMPITAAGKVTMNSAKHVDATASFSGKQTFHMLDGNIKAFVDGPFDFLDSEWTVFSWQGPKIDEEIFRFEKSTMPVSEMKLALDAKTGH